MKFYLHHNRLTPSAIYPCIGIAAGKSTWCETGEPDLLVAHLAHSQHPHKKCPVSIHTISD